MPLLCKREYLYVNSNEPEKKIFGKTVKYDFGNF